jgi:NADPH-dependent glutamate synthase beta subunit-like oxidoreductase
MGLEGADNQKYKRVAPFAQGSTAVYKTGQWSRRKPVYGEKLSPCREACPAGNDIPTAMWMASEGLFDEGLMAILQENPLPGVCGRVCYHPCQSNCNRADFDAAIEIRGMERAFAEHGSAAPSKKESRNSKRIAVIGSGPAGLSAAYFLARFGHQVTIFENRKEPGGVLRYGIPDYRLPKPVVKKEIARILSLGITLRTSYHVDAGVFDSLKTDYDTLFLSTGAWVPRDLGLGDETGPNVLYGLDFLSSPARSKACNGKKAVVVVGGGDVAVDVARTALRSCGANAKITMVAPEEVGSFPAIPEGVAEAVEEGIEMIGGYRPIAFGATNDGDKIRFIGTRVEKDPLTGLYRMVETGGKETELQADLVIVAIGQVPDTAPYTSGLFAEDTGNIYVNEFGATPLTNVYAGGDLIRQKPAVVDAIASGKRAAIAIDMEAEGLQRGLQGFQLGSGLSLSAQAYMEGVTSIDFKRVVHFNELNILLYGKSQPNVGECRRPAARVSGFGEIRKGLDQKKAIEEAKRCFYCGRCIGCDLCYLLCPDMSILRLAKKEYTIDVDYCKGCSICATTCPRHVIEMGE